MKQSWSRCLVVLSLVVVGACYPQAQAQTKPVIHSQADLPHFHFPMKQPASQFLKSDDATFNAFAQKVNADVDSVLSKYEITDKATLRGLLSTRMSAQLLEGNWKGAGATLARIRGLEDKAAARLTFGMGTQAMLEAAAKTGSRSGAAFESAYEKAFGRELAGMPWATVRNSIMEEQAGLELLSPDLIAGSAKANLDPEVKKTGGLNLGGASALLSMRVAQKFELPLAKESLAAVKPYIAVHKVKKPNIWKARSVTLTSAEKLTPVRIAIFDSGVDTSVYPKNLFTDPHPGKHSPHGLAFTKKGKLVDRTLQPMSAAEKAEYPKMLQFFQGMNDLQNGIQTPAAAAARKMLSRMSPGEMPHLMKEVTFFGQYMHGTHVAGIAVRGNPAARLVVI